MRPFQKGRVIDDLGRNNLRLLPSHCKPLVDPIRERIGCHARPGTLRRVWLLSSNKHALQQTNAIIEQLVLRDIGSCLRTEWDQSNQPAYATRHKDAMSGESSGSSRFFSRRVPMRPQFCCHFILEKTEVNEITVA